uniref:Exocyst complex component Sec3 PIP2-binding N-terminal domain-containing protein n=1 Tax=Megaselia scalaris TaxID=36166 RepID=T1GQA2_MEGSC
MVTIGRLANIKHILQKELFDISDERLISVCTVTKTYKKKKACYLCLSISASVTSSSPKTVVFSQVKPTEKDSEYKRKHSWQLDEIKLVDGKDENFETHEFDIQIDKLYKYYAINLHERQNFLGVLYRQINKSVRGEKAVFKNIPAAWLSEKGSPEKSIVKNFKALTEKEVNELNKLVNECDFAIKDAELFIEQLGKKLHDLDGANIQSVLASEKQVFSLVEEIEKAVGEVERFESRLDSYDDILNHVKESMEKVGSKNAMIEIANNNNTKLLNELNGVICQLDLPSSAQQALSDPDLKTVNGRQAAINAGKALQQAMNSDIDPALLRLTAVQDQRKRFEKWKLKFSSTISRYVNNLFIHLGNDIGEGNSQSQSHELILQSHSNVHKELAAYMELMHWTKAMDRKTYDGLTKVYTSSLSKIYERDIKAFFNNVSILFCIKIICW